MKKIPQKNHEWEGYTMDRLVYERAVTLARIELEKERIVIEGNRVRQGNLFFNKSTFSRLMGMINYADFLVIGVKLWRRIAPLLHHNTQKGQDKKR